MKGSGKKIIKFVCLGLIAFVVCFQLYQSLYTPVTTGSVIHYETYEGIDITAVAIRDETLVTTDKDGVISYNVDDGGKIEQSGIVADVYSSDEDASAATRIEALEKYIDDLEEIEGYNNVEAVDIDMLDSKIDDALLELISVCESGNIGNSISADKLLKLINRRQVVTGVSGGFGTLISEYKAELSTLKSEKQGAKAHIKAKKPGYFVSSTDGYETVLKSDEIDKLTPDALTAAAPKTPEKKGKIIGKIVSDYDWYLAATISLNDSLRLSEGDEITLLTNFDSARELPVTVKKINKGSSGDTALAIFECTYMNSDLATMREQEMTIVLEKYTGLQVNSKAVRFVDGEKGVYVLSGSVVHFVPVNIIYSTDSYCICEAETTGVRLKLYDEVVIKGKNLYDGKVISR